MIGLVGCSAQKLDRPAPACELYRSRLFRLALAYAEPRCQRVYVLSAKLGLVELDAVLEPYEQRLAGQEKRENWARPIASALIARHGHEIDYLILAGRDYADPLTMALCTADRHRGHLWRGVPRDRILLPLAGMQIGQRLQWLGQQLAVRAA